MLTGPLVILALKIAVATVTVLLLGSLVALLLGKVRLHGRINIAFFILTMTALVLFEGVIRVVDPAIFDYFSEDQTTRLRVHLCFAVPAAVLMPVMLYTGLKGHRTLHWRPAFVFGFLWIGTFITGIFYL